MSIADELEKLGRLREQGIITDSEFAAQKEVLLSGSGGRPVPAPGPPAGPMPPTYMAHAVFATVLCCLPFGIVAIVKAGNVTSAYNRGDYGAATAASNEAKNWVNYSVLGGILVSVLYFAAGLM